MGVVQAIGLMAYRRDRVYRFIPERIVEYIIRADGALDLSSV